MDDQKERLIEVVNAALAVFSGPGDYRPRARVIVEAILAEIVGDTLYQSVWAVIEEFIINAPTIDLNTHEGQARMQVVCALLTTAIHNPHDLNLEGDGNA